MHFALMLLCFICLPLNKAQAQKTGALISGAYLMELCKSDAQGEEQAPGAHVACQSYIAGVVDYHNLLRSLGTSPNVDICVPSNASLNDLQAIVSKYLAKNKHHYGFIAAPAVNLALLERFPCKKKKK
jgi:hypothetical protein